MSRSLQKRRIERMNQEVTFIGFGALEIGRDWGIGTEEEKRRPSEEEAGQVLNAVLDLGINLIDTASAYHRSEERIGKFISGQRDKYVLASKCGEHNNEPKTYYDFSYNAIKESIDRSLMLLNTDHIDVMQIHFGPDPQKVLDDGETVAAMKDAKKEGKIRFLGASIDGELAKRCILSDDFDVMQMDYSLLNQKNSENIQLAKERGMGVFIRGGLAYGRLTPRVKFLMSGEFQGKETIGKLLHLVNDDADALTVLALQFLYRNEGISSVLVGTKNLNHLKANITSLDRPFDDELIEKATNIMKSL